YGIALRFASPMVAAAVTLLAVVWSFPNYFAGLPSWYNLFFATVGTLAIIRYIETQRRRWLFIAGLCGGFSFLAKVSGIYYIGAALPFLLYREQVLSGDQNRYSKPRLSYFFAFKVLGYAAFIGAVTALLRSRLGLTEIIDLLLPTASICGVLTWTEWKTDGQGRFGPRFRRLASEIVPLSLGVVIPVLVILLPYIVISFMGDFYR